MENTSQKQRRQRAILSCNDCRRRKLRCDRLAPCNRCIKGGIASSCAYGPEAHSDPPDDMYGSATRKRQRFSSRLQSSTVPDIPHVSESGSDVGNQMESVQSNVPARERLEQLEREVMHLQQLVPNHMQAPRDQVEFLANSPELKGVDHSSAVMGMLKGHSYGTHFHGTSSAMAVVGQVSEPMNEL
jgi:hypothetical protein